MIVLVNESNHLSLCRKIGTMNNNLSVISIISLNVVVLQPSR